MKFRFDRSVSLVLARLMSIRRTQPASGRFPILMYHGINGTLSRRHPYFETNTSPAVFRSQMQVLATGGYQPLSVDDALTPSSRAVAKRPVAITFDDGYADFYDEALPILVEFGFAATVYIVTGSTGKQRVIKNGKRFMSWADVCDLPKCGIRVGSHTVSHRNLREMSRSRVEEEVRRSKEMLEDKLGAPVESFAYPYAFPEHDKKYVQYVREYLQMCGYKNAVSTIIGTARVLTDRYLLPRLPINTFDDDAFLRVKLEGGYEWLHALQYTRKAFSRRRV
ncbi:MULTISPECIES: polysaccharide deacetylase family protein [Acidobacteriaceae]|uniref:polysaccharide deacetylase family protein n=1 Tax=Acidobacteriaceae TaxID=204434 RepID=UPI00131ECD3C|nr:MULTISPECIES: polysaccharide deacetylase family protein [Acidobacteriaceae]MDW5265946.1 polysaccharide deacetylase family protein [Edaphobacter sp.]